MKRKKDLFLVTALALTMGLAACNQQVTETVPTPVESKKTMTINSTDIEITHIPYEQYQIELLKDSDYYTDVLEEPDSPEYVFIAPASKSVYRDVTDVQVDDSQNVTITIRENTADMVGSSSYPITMVTIYPYPASISVVDEQGNALTGN